MQFLSHMDRTIASSLRMSSCLVSTAARFRCLQSVPISGFSLIKEDSHSCLPAGCPRYVKVFSYVDIGRGDWYSKSASLQRRLPKCYSPSGGISHFCLSLMVCIPHEFGLLLHLSMPAHLVSHAALRLAPRHRFRFPSQSEWV
jgi:hypothetical protein